MRSASGKHLFRILKIAERRVGQLDRLQVERVSIGLAGLLSSACARIGQMRFGCCGVGSRVEYHQTTNLGVRSSNLFGRATKSIS
jgi:hypothetical protein